MKRQKGQKRNEEKRKGKERGRGKEKEIRQGLNILKNYRVTMKIRNRKAKKKHFEENVIC